MSAPKNRRILVIDDTPAIHLDFRKLLAPAPRASNALEAAESALFGVERPAGSHGRAYELDDALQGKEGVEMVTRAVRSQRPYALVFVDMRMPPGIDGVETMKQILEVTSKVELCICSAYSDYSWHDIIRRLGRPNVRLLRKPFETSEVLAVASELTDKWNRLNKESAPPNGGAR